ncbi:MAG: CHAD domain-containing protein [Rhodocyclaceae bacterium]|nr:CHAD domain-containing protein [Rhodocyclaceae bacterium]MDZ4214756.1 CHAD domain-containing protein [Rhodocyclaceae bacterium]
MSQEIELKLALPEAEHHNFLRHPLLRKATRRESYQLVNLYYDTPELALRKHGVALRLRAQGKVWLQTVKCAGQAAGGISARPEWETPYAGHFDFSAVDDLAVRDWLDRPKLRSRIAPIFETNFMRMAWILAPAAGTELMLVLDRGWIAAGGRREAISEIEIELLHGDAAQLFSVARTLAVRVPVAPAARSKADRGYRLFKQVPMTPVKAAPLALAAADDPVVAFSRIALSCLDHLQQNHVGAVSVEDPEYIHQMRVATRRLRAALRLFAPLLPADFATPMVAALRDMMAVLGQARDLDVLLAEIAEPVLHALPDEPRLAALIGIITDRRFERRRAAVDFLRSPRYGLVTLETLADLHGHAEKVGVGEAAPETAAQMQQLGEFATDRLQRLRKKVLKLARAARIDDPPSLHALRIGIKRLRYALEFFSPLASPIAMRRILGHLATLQETLGQINDLANAGELLMDCAGKDAPLREAVTLIGGWHGPRHHALLAAIKPGLKHLGNLRLPKLRP